ncbi:ABC transporter permease [Pontibacillus sp. HMF3514]|uniref:ABC transporter permease n=1 Tax=Pontibacillus sp. HMF3514 TaxID=2692425 RepID=UPI0013204195|nr:ABC transporter permease [Pontibacillus sp. HMF3514]QHE51222.1 ABC transporter permease [Pontibacillus sp. HMF3514]
MLTYLTLNVHKWKRRPFLFLLLLLLPLLAFLALYPLFKSSVSDIAIPVALVDEDESQWSEIVQERVAQDNRVRIIDMDREKAKVAVQKGDVEAAFVLNQGFMEAIRSGNISDSVQWLRTEQSELDVFVKEQIGAEIMRLALNAKAANTLQNWGANVDWEEAFQHADEYWDPNPLFQMEYIVKTPKQGEAPDVGLAQWMFVVIALFFLYAWLWFISLLKGIVQDEKAGRTARVLFLRSSLTGYYFMHFITFFVVISGSFFLALNGLFYVTNTSQELMTTWNVWSACVLFGTMLLTLIVFLLGKRSSKMLVVITVFTFISFTVNLLPMQPPGVMGALFPHNWLTDLNPWEAGGM